MNITAEIDITKLPVIYPNDKRKYGGWMDVHNIVFHNINGKIERQNGFKSYEEAEQYRIEKSVTLGQVRNLCYDLGNYYLMKLTQNKYTKIDKDMFSLLDKYTWSTTHHEGYGHYVRTTIGRNGIDSRGILMHHLIKKFIPNNGLTIDHINRDSLDNRLENLRITNKSIQSMNQKCKLKSSCNVKGVNYVPTRDSWVVNWFENGKRYNKSFTVKKYGKDEAFEKAVKCREDAIKAIMERADIYEKKPIPKPIAVPVPIKRIIFTEEEEKEFEKEFNEC
jgi:hypothetical protein